MIYHLDKLIDENGSRDNVETKIRFQMITLRT